MKTNYTDEQARDILTAAKAEMEAIAAIKKWFCQTFGLETIYWLERNAVGLTWCTEGLELTLLMPASVGRLLVHNDVFIAPDIDNEYWVLERLDTNCEYQIHSATELVKTVLELKHQEHEEGTA